MIECKVVCFWENCSYTSKASWNDYIELAYRNCFIEKGWLIWFSLEKKSARLACIITPESLNAMRFPTAVLNTRKIGMICMLFLIPPSSNFDSWKLYMNNVCGRYPCYIEKHARGECWKKTLLFNLINKCKFFTSSKMPFQNTQGRSLKLFLTTFDMTWYVIMGYCHWHMTGMTHRKDTKKTHSEGTRGSMYSTRH